MYIPETLTKETEKNNCGRGNSPVISYKLETENQIFADTQKSMLKKVNVILTISELLFG